MGIGRVLPKCSLVNMVVDREYMFPMRLMESVGYPKSFIMARSLAWSIEPKAFGSRCI
jgi:hypothetical protein